MQQLLPRHRSKRRNPNWQMASTAAVLCLGRELPPAHPISPLQCSFCLCLSLSLSFSLSHASSPVGLAMDIHGIVLFFRLPPTPSHISEFVSLSLALSSLLTNVSSSVCLCLSSVLGTVPHSFLSSPHLFSLSLVSLSVCCSSLGWTPVR